MKHKKSHPKPIMASGPNSPMMHGHDKYQVQEAVHTLRRAAEIKADPKLHAAAKHHARAEAHALKKVAGRDMGKK